MATPLTTKFRRAAPSRARLGDPARAPRPMGGHGGPGRKALAVVLVVGLAWVTGCSSSQPTADGGFLPGVPLYPGSAAFGTTTVTGSITMQSFRLSSGSPTTILRWYRSHLNGWKEIDSPGISGATDQTGRWMSGSRTLQVSASPSGKVTQYGLIVTADGAASP